VPAFDLPPSGKGYGEPIQTIFSFQDGETVVTGLALNRETVAMPSREPQHPASATSPGAQADAAAHPPRLLAHQLGLFETSQDRPGEKEDGAAGEPAAAPGEASLVLVSRAGKGLRLPWAQLNETTLRAGRQVMKIAMGDALAQVVTGESPWLLLATEKRVVVVNRQEIAQLTGPGKGVKLMTTDASGIRNAIPLGPGDVIQVVNGAGTQKEYASEYFFTIHRGAKGRVIQGGIQDLSIVRA
jgi:hypothetical protein